MKKEVEGNDRREEAESTSINVVSCRQPSSNYKVWRCV